MDWIAFIERAPKWLLAVTLTAGVSVLVYSANTEKCFKFFGFQFGQCEGVLPIGTVIAFDLPKCPPDWESDEAYQGRFIIGAGKGNNLTDRPFRVTGGEEKHTLIVDEMPAHFHVTSRTASTSGTGRFPINTSMGETPDTTNGGATHSTGKDQPHSIMPPYIPLSLCRRK